MNLSNYFGYSESINVPVSLDGKTVSSIGQYCYRLNKTINSLSIGTNINSLGFSAFSYCSSLKKVVFPDSLAYFPQKLFYNCTSLEEVNFPASLTELPMFTFFGCSSLKKISLGENVEALRFRCFSDCSGLSSVDLGESLTTIENMAFSDCYSLSSITLPKSLSLISFRAFYDCGSLKNVYYGGSMKEWGGITLGNEAFKNTQAVVHCSDGDISLY